MEYGTIPTYTGETPTRESAKKYPYMFIEWSPSIVSATENATYTAVFKYFIDIDGEITTGLSNATSEKIKVIKNNNLLTIKFTSYTTTNIFGDTVTKKPPYTFINILNDVLGILQALSSNVDCYESFELYYKHESDKSGQTIDLADFDLSDSSIGSWLGDGPNAKIGRWVGYLATGESSIMAAYESDTSDLVGKKITGTIKLKDGYVFEDGSDETVYYISFSQ